MPEKEREREQHEELELSAEELAASDRAMDRVAKKWAEERKRREAEAAKAKEKQRGQ